MGFLDPAYQVKLMPTNNGGGERCVRNPSACQHMHTLVVRGPVRVFAYEAHTLDAQDKLCRQLNGALGPRMFVFSNVDHTTTAVYSQDECAAVTRGQCGHTELTWQPYDEVLPVKDYLAAHFHPSATPSARPSGQPAPTVQPDPFRNVTCH